MNDADMAKKLAKERAELRQVVTEAHEALKDLRAATRDAYRAAAEMTQIIDSTLQRSTDKMVAAEVEKQIDAMRETFKTVAADGEKRILKRFDQIFNLLTDGGRLENIAARQAAILGGIEQKERRGK